MTDEVKIRIIPDEDCDAAMLRAKLRAIRMRVIDARLMLKNCLGDVIGLETSDPPKQLQLAKAIRWTLDHIDEPLERTDV